MDTPMSETILSYTVQFHFFDRRLGVKGTTSPIETRGGEAWVIDCTMRSRYSETNYQSNLAFVQLRLIEVLEGARACVDLQKESSL